MNRKNFIYILSIVTSLVEVYRSIDRNQSTKGILGKGFHSNVNKSPSKRKIFTSLFVSNIRKI